MISRPSFRNFILLKIQVFILAVLYSVDPLCLDKLKKEPKLCVSLKLKPQSLGAQLFLLEHNGLFSFLTPSLTSTDNEAKVHFSAIQFVNMVELTFKSLGNSYSSGSLMISGLFSGVYGLFGFQQPTPSRFTCKMPSGASVT